MKKGVLLLGILIACISAGTGVYFRLQRMAHTPVAVIKETVLHDAMTGKVNILLLGEDNVEGSHRTDSIALAAVDLDAKSARVLSLPRDTRVEIPGHGWQKLNHSYAFGGVDLLRSTVSKNLGVPIHYYILLDYGTFPRMVDIIGGVDLHVPKRLRYVDRAGHLNIDIPAGEQHLDGERALHFVRFRHDALGDIGRVQRQQQFIKAALAKLKQPEYLTRIPDLAKEIVAFIRTDLTASQSVQLGGFVKELDRERILFAVLPGKPDYLKGISYWIPDSEGARTFFALPMEALLSADQGTARSTPSMNPGISTAGDGAANPASSGGTKEAAPPDTEQMTPEEVLALIRAIPEPVSVLNGVGKAGLSQTAAEHLQRMGVDVVYTGNAKHYDYRFSNVVYPEKASATVHRTAETLARLCGIRPALVRPGRQAVSATLVLGRDYKTIFERLSLNQGTGVGGSVPDSGKTSAP
ncbi:cell envelope-related transcriptional attenuator [Aminomonas paucivorans DSM 12260]|uniref:Cell envelope-related transcriptional attenuator n=1 Tax=Aminomonas paucivorans DSM 12260 TaxID=584708 RepID=E3D0R5_9BACT|nr:cell envelope-related transcriptional attenuator [Aminomonas paucivorans DSM 12260]